MISGILNSKAQDAKFSPSLPKIPDFTCKNFLESVIQIALPGAPDLTSKQPREVLRSHLRFIERFHSRGQYL